MTVKQFKNNGAITLVFHFPVTAHSVMCLLGLRKALASYFDAGVELTFSDIDASIDIRGVGNEDLVGDENTTYVRFAKVWLSTQEMIRPRIEP